MHRSFRKKLDKATGVSEFVIAVNVDIRGFSNWSLSVDSAQTALFIKKVYAKLIDQYFSEASFFKPTGDGLLVILGFDEDRVDQAVQKVIGDSISIVESFSTLCEDEPVVNFPVPENVGIGISRGPASRLLSGGVTLDYSGRVLNLASRLMDLARPRGVVFDTQLGFDLLPKELKRKFRKQKVYLSGVSPRQSIEVQCWPKALQIPAVNLSPIGKPTWEHVEHSCTRDDFGGEEDFVIGLPGHPPDPRTLRCEVKHDSVTDSGKRSSAYSTTFTIPVKYLDAAGDAKACFDQKHLLEQLEEAGVGPKWPIDLKISYRSS